MARLWRREEALSSLSSPDSYFALARYKPDGTLDESFGTAGKVTTEFLGFDDSANAIAIQSDGKIVAAGGASTLPSSVVTLR